MPWNQVYDPLGSPVLSTALAALPVFVLLGSLASLRIKAHLAALFGLGSALAVSILVFGMPAGKALGASLFGAAYGLFPIGWIILNVIFLYNLAEEKGHFKVLRDSLTGITGDRRLQLLLIAFSFGAFFEAAAGFGTPVAVTAAILIGLGFSPLMSSGLSLVANTAPVAFGGLGTPIIALAGVTGIDILKLSAMVGRQLPVFSIVIPFWLVWAYAGFGGMIEVWPALLTAGVAFAVPQFLISNYHGPWLAGIGASVVSIFALIGLLLVWKPKRIWGHEGAEDDDGGPRQPRPRERGGPQGLAALAHPERHHLRLGDSPGQGVPRRALQPQDPRPGRGQADQPCPARGPGGDARARRLRLQRPVVHRDGDLHHGDHLRPHHGLPVSGGRGHMAEDPPARALLAPHRGRHARPGIYVTRYSGLDATLGLAFAGTGVLYPFFGTLLGWLGVALTGLGHLVQRPLREPPDDLGRTARA